VKAAWRYLALSGCFFLGYHALIFGLFLVRAGAWPNYFKIFNFVPDILETLSYHPPFRELVELLPEQPIYLYGWVFEKTSTIEWLFTFTLHNLFMSVLLSCLLAANAVLLKTLTARGGPVKGSACAGGVAGIMGTGVSAAACCGSGSSSLLLSTLGLGSSLIGFIEDFAAPLEWFGIGLLVWSTVHLYRKRRWLAADAAPMTGEGARNSSGGAHDGRR
jgi:hypothetical protein